MASLHQMVRLMLRELLQGELAHIARPAVQLARVTRATEQGDYTVYGLRLLGANLADDSTLPEIPGVKSKLPRIEAGATVAVALPYGRLEPVILGEVVP